MSARAIAVLNAGSSSLKFSLFCDAGPSGQPRLMLRGQVENPDGEARLLASDATGVEIRAQQWPGATPPGHAGALQWVLPLLREQLGDCHLVGVGHRVVHGGTHYVAPIRVDDSVLADLERLIPLAPLHQAHNLSLIRSLRERMPELRQVACFDTAFHRGHPQLFDMYALPWHLYDEGVRRYGFHGLSYEYVAGALRQVAPEVASGRVIIAHLGSGASLCALRDGRSLDTTMGFSPLDGIPMGTRPGAMDAGILLYLMSHCGYSVARLEQLLYHESGLLGISGLSHDVRALLASVEPRARLAVDYFVHRVAREIGALTATLGGLDALVFTAGIGANSPEIRARVARSCEWLGLRLDDDANQRGDCHVAAVGSAVSAWVIATDEESVIARHTLELF